MLHAWGMTETTPVGSVCRLTPHLRELPDAVRSRIRAYRGPAVPFVEMRAVVGFAHPRRGERPVACVVLREGSKATPSELREFLEPLFAEFQLPDGLVFLAHIPRTVAGKFLKSALREQLEDLGSEGT